MPYYHLQRVSDGQRFKAVAANDDGALFIFSDQVGEDLTFNGDGPAPYRLAKNMTSSEFINLNISVYRKIT